MQLLKILYNVVGWEGGKEEEEEKEEEEKEEEVEGREPRP